MGAEAPLSSRKLATKPDLRVMKTTRAIEGAFFTVLRRKGFDAMTVQDIIDEALVNRKTFYNHYRDKYDLADVVIEKVIKEIEDMRAEHLALAQEDGYMTYDGSDLALVYRFIRSKREDVLALWDVRTDKVSFKQELTTRLQSSYLNAARAVGREADATSFQAFLYAKLAASVVKEMLCRDEMLDLQLVWHEASTMCQITIAHLERQAAEPNKDAND